MSERVDAMELIEEYSIILDNVKFEQSGDDILSSDDLAWADSCFIKDSEISDSVWDSVKNALQEIETSHSIQSSVSGRIDSLSLNLGRTDDDNVSSNDDDEEEEEEDGVGGMVLGKIAKSRPKTKGIYPFRPKYEEYVKESEDSYFGLDSGFLDFTADPFAEGIFKVWNLDIPVEEEDELINRQQLAESSLSTFDDLEAWKDLNDVPLDNLITGISDLSLDGKSG